MTSERERPAGTVSCPACGGAAVVCDGAGELPCDECGCTGSVDAVDEVRRLRERVKHYQMQATHHAIRDLDERDALRERAELQGAALRVVALWLGGPNHSPQPADVEELAQAKGKELDALRAASRELLDAEFAARVASTLREADPCATTDEAAASTRAALAAARRALASLLPTEAPRG